MHIVHRVYMSQCFISGRPLIIQKHELSVNQDVLFVVQLCQLVQYCGGKVIDFSDELLTGSIVSFGILLYLLIIQYLTIIRRRRSDYW